MGNRKGRVERSTRRFVVRVKEIGVRGIRNHKQPDFSLVFCVFHMRHNCDPSNTCPSVAYNNLSPPTVQSKGPSGDPN